MTKIAIFSDVHDHLDNLALVWKKIEEDKEIKQVLFLGDFVHKKSVQVMSKLSLPIYAIWGNNEDRKDELIKISQEEGSNLDLVDADFRSLEIGGKKIFMSHHPELAKEKAESGDYDIVFHGHTHVKNKDMVGDCPLINPGEVAAWKTGKISFAVYDTKANDVEFILVV